MLPVLGIILILAGTPPSGGTGNPEFDEYVAAIRARGTTEGAELALANLTSILPGATVLTLEKTEEGDYRKSYTAALCPVPGADPAGE
jgi:hypothetical protein